MTKVTQLVSSRAQVWLIFLSARGPLLGVSSPSLSPCHVLALGLGEEGGRIGQCKTNVRGTAQMQNESQTMRGAKGGVSKVLHRRGGWPVRGQAEEKGEAGMAGEGFTMEVTVEWSLQQRVGGREHSRLRLQHQQRAGGRCPVLRRPYPRLVAEKLKGDRWRGSPGPGAI